MSDQLAAILERLVTCWEREQGVHDNVYTADARVQEGLYAQLSKQPGITPSRVPCRCPNGRCRPCIDHDEWMKQRLAFAEGAVVSAMAERDAALTGREVAYAATAKIKGVLSHAYAELSFSPVQHGVLLKQIEEVLK